jgi:hypothetical protein
VRQCQKCQKGVRGAFGTFGTLLSRDLGISCAQEDAVAGPALHKYSPLTAIFVQLGILHKKSFSTARLRWFAPMYVSSKMCVHPYRGKIAAWIGR